MLKKLRRKFILISMVSVFFVLAVTVSGINISNKVVIENQAKNTLEEVIRIGATEQPKGEFKKPNDGPNKDNDNFKESHYFITVYNSDGSVKEGNYSRVFALTDLECLELTNKVYKDDLKGSRYEWFRFKKAVKEDGLVYVAFVDIKGELENFNSFLLSSSLISVGAYGLLFVLILIASKIAFKPSEEAYKKQKKFITNASHELKTPLTIISADLDLIEMDNGKTEWSDSIRNQVNRLNMMTKQLVELSKLEEDEATNYPFEDFSLNEVCNKAINEFTSSFKKENIKFASNITGNITMYGNKYLIDELIYIFLDNSLKYTGGDNKSSYFVVCKNDKNKIEFKFSNTIDKNDETDINQILERFYRSPSSKTEGSGIGLSIAQEIVKLHKGNLKIEKNNSTITFYVTFE